MKKKPISRNFNLNDLLKYPNQESKERGTRFKNIGEINLKGYNSLNKRTDNEKILIQVNDLKLNPELSNFLDGKLPNFNKNYHLKKKSEIFYCKLYIFYIKKSTNVRREEREGS